MAKNTVELDFADKVLHSLDRLATAMENSNKTAKKQDKISRQENTTKEHISKLLEDYNDAIRIATEKLEAQNKAITAKEKRAIRSEAASDFMKKAEKAQKGEGRLSAQEKQKRAEYAEGFRLIEEFVSGHVGEEFAKKNLGLWKRHVPGIMKVAGAEVLSMEEKLIHILESRGVEAMKRQKEVFEDVFNFGASSKFLKDVRKQALADTKEKYQRAVSGLKSIGSGLNVFKPPSGPVSGFIQRGADYFGKPNFLPSLLNTGLGFGKNVLNTSAGLSHQLFPELTPEAGMGGRQLATNIQEAEIKIAQATGMSLSRVEGPVQRAIRNLAMVGVAAGEAAEAIGNFAPQVAGTTASLTSIMRGIFGNQSVQNIVRAQHGAGAQLLTDIYSKFRNITKGSDSDAVKFMQMLAPQLFLGLGLGGQHMNAEAADNIMSLMSMRVAGGRINPNAIAKGVGYSQLSSILGGNATAQKSYLDLVRGYTIMRAGGNAQGVLGGILNAGGINFHTAAGMMHARQMRLSDILAAMTGPGAASNASAMIGQLGGQVAVKDLIRQLRTFETTDAMKYAASQGKMYAGTLYSISQRLSTVKDLTAAWMAELVANNGGNKILDMQAKTLEKMKNTLAKTFHDNPFLGRAYSMLAMGTGTLANLFGGVEKLAGINSADFVALTSGLQSAQNLASPLIDLVKSGMGGLAGAIQSLIKSGIGLSMQKLALQWGGVEKIIGGTGQSMFAGLSGLGWGVAGGIGNVVGGLGQLLGAGSIVNIKGAFSILKDLVTNVGPMAFGGAVLSSMFGGSALMKQQERALNQADTAKSLGDFMNNLIGAAARTIDRWTGGKLSEMMGGQQNLSLLVIHIQKWISGTFDKIEKWFNKPGNVSSIVNVTVELFSKISDLIVIAVGKVTDQLTDLLKNHNGQAGAALHGLLNNINILMNKMQNFGNHILDIIETIVLDQIHKKYPVAYAAGQVLNTAINMPSNLVKLGGTLLRGAMGDPNAPYELANLFGVGGSGKKGRAPSGYDILSSGLTTPYSLITPGQLTLPWLNQHAGVKTSPDDDSKKLFSPDLKSAVAMTPVPSIDSTITAIALRNSNSTENVYMKQQRDHLASIDDNIRAMRSDSDYMKKHMLLKTDRGT